MNGVLLRLVHGVVEEVMGNLTREMSNLTDQVEQPLTNLVKGSEGQWEGKSAEAFRLEVQTRIFREIVELIQAIVNFRGNIGRSVSTIDEADEQCFSLVNNLGDIIDGI